MLEILAVFGKLETRIRQPHQRAGIEARRDPATKRCPWGGRRAGTRIKVTVEKEDHVIKLHGEFRRLLAERRMTATIAQGLKNADYKVEAANALACLPSVSAHNWLRTAANALDWVVRGGIDSLPDEKFNNELCDLDYLVAASFCEELITKEKKMRRFHDHLRHVVNLRWAEVRTLILTANEKARIEDAWDQPS